MRGGRLRHRVSFQTQTSAKDATGQKQDDWTPVATVWADVEDLSSAEILASGGFSAQVSTLVTIRHRSGISPGMRAVVGSRTLEIVGPPIDRDGRSRQLEIACKEITP